MIFKVDYLARDPEKYKAEKPVVPMYIVAASFKAAMNKASQYESDNLTLLEVKLAATVGNVALAEGFTGV